MSGFYTEIQCPKCGTKMRTHRIPLAPYFTCKICKTYYSKEGQSYTIKGDFKREQVETVLKKGDECTIDNIKYTVVGLTTVKEIGSHHYWDEIMLYSPNHDTIFLTCYAGHWNVVKPIEGLKHNNLSNIKYKDISFQKFSKYKMFYTAAYGEFDFNLITKEDKLVVEYISPPYSIIKETLDNETHFFLAKYVTHEELITFFNNKIKVPGFKSNFTYTNQPNKFNKFQWLINYTASFVSAIIFYSILTGFITPSKTIFEETVNLPNPSDSSTVFNTTANNMFVSKDIKLDSPWGTSSIEVNIDAPVDNTWLENEINLINQNTDEEFNMEIGVEYYHGYEGGENWSEGSQDDDKVLSRVPNGTYKISIIPHLDASVQKTNPVSSYTIKVKQNVFLTSNFLLIFIGICLVPVYFYIRKSMIESSRWANSEYGNN